MAAGVHVAIKKLLSNLLHAPPHSFHYLTPKTRSRFTRLVQIRRLTMSITEHRF